MAIPTDREVSIIAAIGPLNNRKEANAHSHTASDHNVDDIRINFSTRVSRDENISTNLLFCSKLNLSLE